MRPDRALQLPQNIFMMVSHYVILTSLLFFILFFFYFLLFFYYILKLLLSIGVHLNLPCFHFNARSCRWLDSNPGPLGLQATALPTAPQPFHYLPFTTHVAIVGFSDDEPRLVAEIVSFFNSPDRLTDLRASERLTQVSERQLLCHL